MFYFVELVSGRLLQMTNADKSRTFAAVHQHAGRLYIHQATVPSGMPEPILFMQLPAWADEKDSPFAIAPCTPRATASGSFLRRCRRTPFGTSLRRSMERQFDHRRDEASVKGQTLECIQ